MVSLHLIFYACLELRLPDVETNPGPRRPVPGACRILCSNVRSLSRNLSDVTVDSSQYDLLLWSETLVSDSRLISELLVPGFGLPVLLCRDGMPQTRGMAAYVWGCIWGMDMGHFANQNLSVAVGRLKTLKTFIATVCQYNTIQCYLSTECIQNRFFLFLKDCTSKHVGPIVSYKGF